MRESAMYLRATTLGTRRGVAQDVDDAAKDPGGAEDGSGHGVAQARDGEGREERDDVLAEVGVSALGYGRDLVLAILNFGIAIA